MKTLAVLFLLLATTFAQEWEEQGRQRRECLRCAKHDECTCIGKRGPVGPTGPVGPQGPAGFAAPTSSCCQLQMTSLLQQIRHDSLGGQVQFAVSPPVPGPPLQLLQPLTKVTNGTFSGLLNGNRPTTISTCALVQVHLPGHTLCSDSTHLNVTLISFAANQCTTSACAQDLQSQLASLQGTSITIQPGGQTLTVRFVGDGVLIGSTSNSTACDTIVDLCNLTEFIQN